MGDSVGGGHQVRKSAARRRRRPRACRIAGARDARAIVAMRQVGAFAALHAGLALMQRTAEQLDLLPARRSKHCAAPARVPLLSRVRVAAADELNGKVETR